MHIYTQRKHVLAYKIEIQFRNKSMPKGKFKVWNWETKVETCRKSGFFMHCLQTSIKKTYFLQE